jgi:threo-3-hydroxy-L-aspartate ammonia-lyase
MISLDDVRAAGRRIDGVAHRTPVLTSRALDAATGATVLLKAENLQRVGAFKFRGAYNAVAMLSDAERARGVAAVSSGNHAQALALAAGLQGVRAVVLMPEDAPPGKLAATAGYGAEVVRFDRYAQDREELLAALVEERGLVPVHPYDDERVMAGQGTVALELIEDGGPLDLLLVPVGGGGLISGCSTAAKGLLDGVRVVGVEPEAGDDVRRSLQSGERVRLEVPRTIADALQLPTPGVRNFAVIRERVDDVTVASDAEIIEAMRFLFERVKTVAEPSGACALAGLLAGRVDARGLRVGVAITGGNLSADRFASLVAESRPPV